MSNKKLIEVDLPLDDISCECVNERPIWRNHPSTLLRWWARRPLAACRAVIFASMVDDPSTYLEEPEAQKERESLHRLIQQLVKWENTNNETVLEEARYEIAKSVARSHRETAPTEAVEVLQYLAEKAPSLYDPFSGGGTIPLEAQRLGLRARGSDLNPVAVVISKAMVELPYLSRDKTPVNPNIDSFGQWHGTTGLANDIRYYGKWMRKEAEKRIGHLYPKAKLPDGTEVPVTAWLWAHTVPCANPACGIPMPLMTTFQLSKRTRNRYWTCPIIDNASKKVSFVVQDHNGGVPDKGRTVNGNKREATCVACGHSVRFRYLHEQAKNGDMGKVMIAIVAEGAQGRLFLSPTDTHIEIALAAIPTWEPMGTLSEQSLADNVQNYGITHWHEIYTSRQLTTLTTFSDLLPDARDRMIQDGATDDYADSLSTYLAFAIGKTAEKGCRGVRWKADKSGERAISLFDKQAINIMWDFPEVNPFSDSAGWIAQVELIAKVVAHLPATANMGEVYQADAATTSYATNSPVIITDPPYYDNVGYADLSDFFYVWLRPLLRSIYPELFAGMSTPRNEEIVANHRRFENSRDRFKDLFHKTLQRIRVHCPDQYPTSIFYAYKQQEEESGGRASTGWETMLNAIIANDFQIMATWPIRTENLTRSISHGRNVLASSIVLVCRPRRNSAENIGWGGFLTALRNEMPTALNRLMRETHIAPVDLAQAAIGPGMEIYSRYKSVKKRQNGELVDVSVREALVEINNEIDRYYGEQEGEFDSYTRFCLRWLRQHGFNEGNYGDAETLATAIDVAINPMRGRLLTAEGGIVQLMPPGAYDNNHPNAGGSLIEITTWEASHLMIYHLNPENEDGGGVSGTAEVARRMRDNPTLNSSVESVERLAWVLFNYYDKQEDAWNAKLCNNLVNAWKAIESEMREARQELLPTAQ